MQPIFPVTGRYLGHGVTILTKWLQTEHKTEAMAHAISVIVLFKPYEWTADKKNVPTVYLDLGYHRIGNFDSRMYEKIRDFLALHGAPDFESRMLGLLVVKEAMDEFCEKKDVNEILYSA